MAARPVLLTVSGVTAATKAFYGIKSYHTWLCVAGVCPQPDLPLSIHLLPAQQLTSQGAARSTV